MIITSILLLTILTASNACTDILVTPGASEDGSAMIAYNADSPTLFGSIYHYPASKNTPATRHIYDWDSGVYLGEIDEVPETFNVVGNSNEHGLVIGESTFGGVPILAWNQTGAIMDYGSLIYVTLQRATTAREAIRVMADLMDTYGYYSGGESFSIADKNGEVWLMEVIGRGNDYGRKGSVWVARKVPDGMVTAHANQARITTFPRDDPENCLYADDVVEVAQFYGLVPKDTDPETFSFSDVYDPLDFINARQGEARVWSIFSKIADDTGDFENEYLHYALGVDPKHRMPLWIKPFKKLSLSDITKLMTSHYEDTPLDPRKDVGAGLFEAPYRPRPLTWTFNNTKYHNERTIATPKTGWSFVAQVRPWMPAPLVAVVWFACDDSSTSPRTPFYGSSTSVSAAYSGQGSQDGVKTPLLTFDLGKAFWVQNMVANFAYYRWNDVYPIVRERVEQLESLWIKKVEWVDRAATKAYGAGNVEKAISIVSKFSAVAGDTIHKEWFKFYGELFVRFRDFYEIVPKEDEPVCGCEAKEIGLSDTMKKRIVQDTGNHYLVDNSADDHPDFKRDELKTKVF